MKKISTSFAVFCALALLAAPRAPRAQTITIDSVSGSQFCAGDPFAITFTATGEWGHKNAFTIQLSNDSGTFDNGFQNIGSLQDTAPGTFTITSTMPLGILYSQPGTQVTSITNIASSDTIPWTYNTINRIITPIPNDTTGKIISWDTTYDTIVHNSDTVIYSYDTTYDTTSFGTRYRVRIMGAIPYTVSSDNGADLVIGENPGNITFINGSGVSNTIIPVAEGVPITFLTEGGGNDTEYWNFGDGSAPDTATNGTTTYSTAGLKMVTIRGVASGGCSVSDTSYVRVFDCTAPVIPSDAIVIANDTRLEYVDDSLNSLSTAHPRCFWINPGVTIYGAESTFDTIFAEAGVTVNEGNGNVIYLKAGSAIASSTNGIIIYADGVSYDNWTAMHTPLLECPNLTYDYTQAPPNAIMAAYESVAPPVPSEAIELSPNPTNSIVTLQNIPMGANVMVMNVLGETVQTKTTQSNTNLSLDLSNCAAGTYYIRIASGNSVTTKSIVKE